MPLLARKKILLAKIESTYGTDSTPTGAANAIQTSDLSITPLAGPTVSRNLDRSVLGGDLQIQVGTFVELSFMVEMAGGGAVATAPAYGPLLRACGTAETVTAATSVRYDPISTAPPGLSMYFAHDGQLHKVVGARGSVALQMDPGTIPKYAFTFTGLYVAPSSTGDPTPDFAAYIVPVPVNKVNTATFTLHETAMNVTAFSVDFANEVIYRNIIGEESVQIVDRAVVGTISFESPAISAKNWFEIARLSTLGSLNVIHGTVTGNRVIVSSPSVQLISPTYAESDGVSIISASLSLLPSSDGNDEIRITTT